MSYKHLLSILIASTILLSGCSKYRNVYDNSLTNEAQVTDKTQTSLLLEKLPPPKQPLPVVVYDFQDQTGQFKNNDSYTDYSSAVTKGGLSVLVKALLDTGDGRWFMVAERGALNNLLKERQIIRSTRSEYAQGDGTRLSNLPPLVYGGMLLEGGIIFYDSNTITGGAAAGYFGLSSSAQYHRDIVTVYLRAVNISSGEVILSVNSSKTVFSYGVNIGLTRYLTISHLLEAETGFSINEPGQIAVRQAIETALYSLILEGNLHHLWSFADEQAGKQAIAEYLERRDGTHHNNIVVNNEPNKMDTSKKVSKNSAPITTSTSEATPSGSGITSWFDGLFSDDEEEHIVQGTYTTRPQQSQNRPSYESVRQRAQQNSQQQ